MDSIFDQAIRTADILVATFGNNCEVAVHDFKDMDKSLIYLSGSITERKVGAPITDLVLREYRSAKDGVKDMTNYKTFSKDGKVLKSSTIFLRESEGTVIGALCINVDISLLIQLEGQIQSVTTFDEEKKRQETFSTDVQEVIENIVNEVLKTYNKPPTLLSMDEKVECVGQLEMRGVFMIKGSTDYLATVMGVSKYTIYNYLQKIRSKNNFQVENDHLK
ncbi:hypothetical protein GQ671_06805 [Salinicoccus hispanicus]|uniref:Transcriptional regulator n=2 Tax=Salinicoccus hispanicus TaxID=157225 RepID=A0A6N8U0X2_9STAP|nr:hypothetical protein [Salinicoccus hispanicus]